jgi:sRNA-binding protein
LDPLSSESDGDAADFLDRPRDVSVLLWLQLGVAVFTSITRERRGGASQPVLCYDQRIALDGSLAETVDAEAKDLATRQLAQLAVRKAAKKAAEAAAPAVVKCPCPRRGHFE